MFHYFWLICILCQAGSLCVPTATSSHRTRHHKKEISERLPVWWPLSCAPTLTCSLADILARESCCGVHLVQELSTLAVTSNCLDRVGDACLTQRTAGQSQETRGRRDLYLGASAFLQALHVVTLPSSILIAGVHQFPKRSRYLRPRLFEAQHRLGDIGQMKAADEGRHHLPKGLIRWCLAARMVDFTFSNRQCGCLSPVGLCPSQSILDRSIT